MLRGGRITKSLLNVIKDYKLESMGIATSSHFKALEFTPIKLTLKERYNNLFKKSDCKTWGWENEYLRVLYQENHYFSTDVYSKLDGRKLFRCLGEHITAEQLRKLVKDNKREYTLNQLLQERID